MFQQQQPFLWFWQTSLLQNNTLGTETSFETASGPVYININELLRRAVKITLAAAGEPSPLPKLAFRAPMKGMRIPGKNHNKTESIYPKVSPK